MRFFVIIKEKTNQKERKYELMANKKTIALTRDQVTEIITTMRTGGAGFRKNDKIATALLLEANLGLRIEDILQLRMKDIIRDGARYRLDIVEQKTKKKRTFTVPLPIYQFMRLYCQDNHIEDGQRIFTMGERNVQKYLQKVVDYLGYEDCIGTHSFRKFFATQIYNENGCDIVLVQKLLQHSSVATTQRYIGIEKKVDDALEKQCILI